MQLSKQAIDKIRLNVRCRLRLALELDFSEQWIIRSIDKNKINGPLTTMAAIKIIQEETQLAEDQITCKQFETATGR